MNILLGLKLTSDANMVSDTVSVKHVPFVSNLHVLTDSRYETEIENVTYHYLPQMISRIPLVRVLYRIPVMIKICKREKIKLLICYHLLSYGFAGLVVSKVLNIPVVMHFLGNDLDMYCTKKYLRSVLLWLTSKYDHLTVQGSNSKKFLEEQGLKKISIVPTVCSTNKIQKNNFAQEYDVIFVGRLSKEKRADRLVDILRIIAEKKEDLKAVILGSGPCEAEVRVKIQSHQLTKNVELLGWTDKVYEYLNRSKIFLLTSDNDQLPLALLEAMAAGVVPIASDVGNVSDVVSSVNGYLYEKDDVRSFARAAIRLLDNEELRHQKSLACREKVKEFSLKANTRRWTHIIQKLKQGVRYLEHVRNECSTSGKNCRR